MTPSPLSVSLSVTPTHGFSNLFLPGLLPTGPMGSAPCNWRVQTLTTENESEPLGVLRTMAKAMG